MVDDLSVSSDSDYSNMYKSFHELDRKQKPVLSSEKIYVFLFYAISTHIILRYELNNHLGDILTDTGLSVPIYYFGLAVSFHLALFVLFVANSNQYRIVGSTIAVIAWVLSVYFYIEDQVFYDLTDALCSSEHDPLLMYCQNMHPFKDVPFDTAMSVLRNLDYNQGLLFFISFGISITTFHVLSYISSYIYNKVFFPLLILVGYFALLFIFSKLFSHKSSIHEISINNSVVCAAIVNLVYYWGYLIWSVSRGWILPQIRKIYLNITPRENALTAIAKASELMSDFRQDKRNGVIADDGTNSLRMCMSEISDNINALRIEAKGVDSKAILKKVSNEYADVNRRLLIDELQQESAQNVLREDAKLLFYRNYAGFKETDSRLNVFFHAGNETQPTRKILWLPLAGILSIPVIFLVVYQYSTGVWYKQIEFVNKQFDLFRLNSTTEIVYGIYIMVFFWLVLSLYIRVATNTNMLEISKNAWK